MVCVDLEAAVKKKKKNFLKSQRESSAEPLRAFLELSGEGRSFFGPWWHAQPPGQAKKVKEGHWIWALWQKIYKAVFTLNRNCPYCFYWRALLMSIISGKPSQAL